MDEVRLYEMYLNAAIEERRTDLINRNEDYKNLREKFNEIMNKYPNLQLILEKDVELILNETAEWFSTKSLSKGMSPFERLRRFL